MTYRVTLLKGDGIGPEVTDSVCQIFAAANAPIEWEEAPAGIVAAERYGEPMPKATLDSIRRNRLGLKGPLATPKGKGYKSANVTMRQKLNLYVGLRPVKTMPGIETPYKNVDLVLLRENTQGLYSGIEHEVSPGTVVTLKITTREAARRISAWAFEYMRYNGRRQIHCCHKTPVVPLSDGHFLEEFDKIAAQYPYIQSGDLYVDNLAMALAMDPTGYDVMLMQNLYGDIISDLCAGLVGGLGVVPGANVGDQIAVFEAVHGTAPDIQGKGLANPLAVLNSAILMLNYVGEQKIAVRIEDAVWQVLEEGTYKTKDIGGMATTAEFTAAVIDKL